jgi:hypothetical protein
MDRWSVGTTANDDAVKSSIAGIHPPVLACHRGPIRPTLLSGSLRLGRRSRPAPASGSSATAAVARSWPTSRALSALGANQPLASGHQALDPFTERTGYAGTGLMCNASDLPGSRPPTYRRSASGGGSVCIRKRCVDPLRCKVGPVEIQVGEGEGASKASVLRIWQLSRGLCTPRAPRHRFIDARDRTRRTNPRTGRRENSSEEPRSRDLLASLRSTRMRLLDTCISSQTRRIAETILVAS